MMNGGTMARPSRVFALIYRMRNKALDFDCERVAARRTMTARCRSAVSPGARRGCVNLLRFPAEHAVPAHGLEKVTGLDPHPRKAG